MGTKVEPAQAASPAGVIPAEAYRNALREAADGIFIADENGVYLEVNDAGAELLGLSPAEVVGRTITDFVVEAQHAQFESDIDVVRRGVAIQRERLLRRADGALIAAELTAKRLSDGRIEAIVRDVTTRKKAEEALRESEERFRMLTAAAFEGLCIVGDGIVLDLNEQLASIFRTERSNMIGQRAVSFCSPDQREIAAQRMIAARGDPYEYVCLRPDGSTFEVQARSKPVVWGHRHVTVVALQDISARKQTERALLASEHRFRSYFNLPIVGVAVSSPERQWLEVNDRLCQILGYSREQLMTKTWSDLTHPEDLPANQALFASALAGALDSYSLEKRFIRKDGEIIFTNTSAQCVRRADRSVDYFVTVIQDITSRKVAERDREQALVREKRAREDFTRRLIASQEAERARIAAELHDSLGQNLLLIKHRAQIALAYQEVSAGVREQLETISELVACVISEARQISYDLRPYQLDQLGLTEAIEAMIRATEQATRLKIERRLENVDTAFSPDASINIYRIVQESFNNVLKHASASHVKVLLERDLRQVRLLIEDDGRGFESTDPMGAQPAGLGLQNIGQRVRILGGEMQLKSKHGQGTRLLILLPIEETV